MPEQINTQRSTTLLAGDIGATKTLLGLFNIEEDKPILLREEKFVTKDCGNFDQVIKGFLGSDKIPGMVSLGVAGPVMNDTVNITNVARILDATQLARALKTRVLFINDLEATVYGLSQLSAEDFKTVCIGKENATGNIAVIAPGTGLGEAAAYWDGVMHHPFPTEGGHCDFAARTQTDVDLLDYLSDKYHHVSWERVLSGQGIVNIFEFLHNERQARIPDWLQELLFDGNAASVISANAGQADICTQTMELFFRYLAIEAAQLALKINALGGVFIGGGILPQILPLFNAEVFTHHFADFGRLNFLLKMIPVKIILNPKAALLGAALYGVRRV
jgi:glucokinase